MPIAIRIRRVQMKDLNFLREFCVALYSHYFSDYWEEDGLDEYLKEQFSIEILKRDLATASIHYYIIEAEEKPIGFIKINTLAKIGTIKNSCELEKMYVSPSFSSLGHGKTALAMVCNEMKCLDKKSIFLEVLTANKKAIAFYLRQGFQVYDSINLHYPLFKEELKGIYRMILFI